MIELKSMDDILDLLLEGDAGKYSNNHFCVICFLFSVWEVKV